MISNFLKSSQAGAGAAVGGFFGYNSQEGIEDSPYASTAATGVGLTAGYFMGKGAFDSFTENLASAKSTFTENTYSSRVKSQASSIADSDYKGPIRDFIEYGKDLRESESLAKQMPDAGVKWTQNMKNRVAEEAKFIEMYNTMYGQSAQDLSSIERIMNDGTRAEVNRLNKVSNILSRGPDSIMATVAVKAEEQSFKSVSTAAQLEEHLVSKLGHTQERAALKASRIFEAVGSEALSVSDTALMINNRSDTDQLIGLTKYFDDGSKFTKKGDIRYATMGFNPLADAYAKGASSVAGINVNLGAAISSADPEEALWVMKRAGELDGGVGHKQIKRFQELTKPLHQYVPQDAYSSMSSGAENAVSLRVSESIDVENISLSPEEGKIGKARSLDDYRYEIKKGLREKNPKVAAAIHSGLSINTSSTIRDPRAGFAVTTSMVPAVERNEHVTNVREARPLASSRSALMEGMEAAADPKRAAQLSTQMKGSSLLKTSFASSEFFDVMAEAIGKPWAVTDDGAGLANRRFIDHMSATSTSAVTLEGVNDKFFFGGNRMSEVLLKDGRLDELMKLGPQQREAVLVALSPILGEVKSGEMIGVGQGSKPVSIGREFTHGTLRDVQKTQEGNLKMIFDVVNRPKDNVKLFGTSAKAGYSMLNQGEFEKIAAMKDLIDTGNIYLGKDDGKNVVKMGEFFSPLRNGGRTMSVKGFMNLMDVAKSKRRGVQDGPQLLRDSLNPGERAMLAAMDRSKSVALLMDPKETGFDAVHDLGNKFRQGLISKAEVETQMMQHLQTPGKIGQDLLLTTAERLESMQATHSPKAAARAKEILNTLSSAPLVEVSKDTLREAVSMTWNTADQFGTSYALTTPSPGTSITGAGGKGTHSWLQMQQLHSAGLTDAEIGSLVTKDKAMQQELYNLGNMTQDRGFNLGASDRSSRASVKLAEDSNYISKLFKMAPEDRRESLATRGIHDDFYKLSNEVSGVKSIPIGTVSTPYTGGTEVGGVNSASTLDKIRSRMITTDMAISGASGNARDSLVKQQEGYAREHMQFVKSSHKEMQKKALKATPVSGYSAITRPYKALNNQSTNTAVMGIDRAKMLFGEDVMERVGKEGYLMSGKERHVILAAREPGQSPLSVGAFDLMIDKNIKGKDTKNYLFFPKDTTLRHAQMMDFDWDVEYVNAANTKQSQAAARKYRDVIMRQGEELINISRLSSAKKADKTFSIKKFEGKNGFDYRKYADFISAQAAQGGTRKKEAGLITSTVMLMQESIARRQAAGGDMSRAIAATHLTQNLTENLLKSAHLSTEKFGDGAQTAGAELTAIRNQFLDTGNATRYRADATSIINRTLFSGFEEKRSKIGLSDSQYKNAVDIYKQSVSDMLDADIEFGHAGAASGVNQNASVLKTASRVKKATTMGQQSEIISNLGSGSTLDYGQGSFIEKTARKTSSAESAKMWKDAATSTMKGKGKIIAGGLAGLIGVSLLAASDKGELSARELPAKPQATLPIRSIESYPTRKLKESGYNVRMDGRARSKDLDGPVIEKALFGDRVNTNLNIKTRAD